MNLHLKEKLEWQSSEVDWCEGNFVMTRFIAEFYNTISNVLFFIIPPVLMVLFRQYGKRVTNEVHLVWFMLIVVGVGSVYFHATLSLVGQLVDEMAILWVLMVALALWYPKNYMPIYYRQNGRARFKRAMVLSAFICTALGCVMPVVNMFGLLAFSAPVTVVLVIQIKRTTSDRAQWLGVRCLATWAVAITAWILDKVACSLWTTLHFPYLHCVWHLAVFLASYQACILFAFFDAKMEVPEQMPVLNYWPRWTGDMGIPYIIFKVAGYKPTSKDY